MEANMVSTMVGKLSVEIRRYKNLWGSTACAASSFSLGWARLLPVSTCASMLSK